jgi:THO complex subunit 4
MHMLNYFDSKLLQPQVQAPETSWQHDMFTDNPVSASAYPARASSIETGTKLYISNLDFGVSTEDIKVSPFSFYFVS